jgi:outer membrane protein assembly factor BamB
MRSISRTQLIFDNHARLLLAAVALALCAGCRPSIERSDSAEVLPALRVDPAESSAPTDRWPGWRGANSQGIAADRPLPVSWDSMQGIEWRVALPGTGNSSPVVWDDAVLLTAAVDKGDSTTLEILCLDAGDGSLRWQAPIGPAAGSTHAKNGHASATVATDGRRVVAFFGSRGLVCCDMAGNILWQRSLGEMEHTWGTASSPLLLGDRVIQLADREEDSYIAAFDLESGSPLWRTPRDSYGSWSTPVVVKADTADRQRVEVVVNGTGTDDSDGGQVIAYDPVDGQELWRVAGTTDIVCPTAILGGDWVYSSSGRNGSIIAIEPGGSGDVTASRVAWKLHRDGPYVPTGLCYRNRLYFVSDSGVLSCYNAGNGERLWRSRLQGTFTASLVAGDGKVYALSERGDVYTVAAADTYQLLSTNSMGQRALATPAIAHGSLFIRTEPYLYRVAGVPPAEIARREAAAKADEVAASAEPPDSDTGNDGSTADAESEDSAEVPDRESVPAAP